MESKADLNIQDVHKQSAIMYASEEGHIEIVKELLKYKLALKDLVQSLDKKGSDEIGQLIWTQIFNPKQSITKENWTTYLDP